MNPSRTALAASVVALVVGLQSQPLQAQPVSQAQSTGPSEASLVDQLLRAEGSSRPRAEPDSDGSGFAAIYTNDWLRNARGGLQRGTIDQGKFEVQLTLDLDKQLGWAGTTFYVNGFNTHNNGRIRRDLVGGLNTIAAIEAKSATRLSELWLERRSADGDISLRVGQLAADTEFFFADLSTMFLQSDYPSAAANNQPGGGPAFPLSTPGVRLRFDLGPQRDTSLLFAIFNGNPAGPCAGDPDTCNRHGLDFRVKDPALLQAEAQFRSHQGKDDTGLARQLKVGGWLHLGRFDDLRLDAGGLSLAHPASSGVPATHRRNWGVYGIVDQQLLRPADGDAASGVSAYLRVALNPADRNLVRTYLDGGLVVNGMLPGRPDDKFGIAFIHTRLSDRLRQLDREAIAQGALATPPRDHETNVELTYRPRCCPAGPCSPPSPGWPTPAGPACACPTPG